MASAVIGSLRVVLGIDTAMFDKGLGDAMKTLKGVGNSMQSLGKTMSLSLTAPILGFGAMTVKTAGDFEAAMNRVDAATGATADEFKAMRDMAVKLGADTSFSASESADAMEMLAKNGLKAGQILDGAVQASMQLAAASGSDLAAAADVATDVMMNFGKEAKDLAPLVDGITGVLLESKFGFDDYRLAMGQAGGVAGNLGVTFQDFNAVIAATSSAFASGSDAGTSFKTFLTTLVPKSDQAAAAMEELGLKFFNVDGSMKSMSAIAEELKTKMGGLSDEEMNNKMSTMFGTDAMRTAIMLMKTGGAGIDELKAKIGAASAEEQAAARLKGFNGELEKLGGAFETLQIAIADSGLLAMVTSFVTMLAGWIEALAATSPALLQWGTILAGLAAVLGPLLITLGAIASAIAAVGLPIAGVVAGLGLLTTAVIAFWPEIQAAWEWVKKLVDIFIQLHTEALVAVIAKFEELRTAIIASLAGLGEQILATFRALPSQMMQIGADIINGLWQGIQNKWEELKGGVADIASGIKDTFTGFFDINSPSRVMAEIGQFIMQGLGNGMESMRGQVVGVAGGVASDVKGSFGEIENAGQSLGQSFSSAFQGVIDGSKSVKEALADLLGSLSETWMNQAFQALLGGGVAGNSGGLLGSIFGGLGSLIGFANGGSFEVGGAGGIDSQLVAFRASPNETVSITKPGQERAAGGGMHVTFSADVDKSGNLVPFVTSVSDQRIERAAPSIVGAANRQVVPVMAGYQANKVGGDYRVG
ncbi:phage tail tape measure protein [Ensifer sp. ENS07]|uniref:phage tail tape measure protein n=1 Tax=Ensifer sp. ENS07 TaxID=2769274 RepID=UPI001785CB0D|nr:phage tail tape measure protein [Ensifer sp. ENS07]MBD9640737.1 phage tail tape measure protein [Ensifer sp. ENS07]